MTADRELANKIRNRKRIFITPPITYKQHFVPGPVVQKNNTPIP
jgi:hypothetical protein